jgi:RNA polymerase sigma-70 factor (ECF subfamily)
MSSTRANDGRRKEQELVAAIVAGEEGRFEELYQRYYGRVFGFALRRVGNNSDAEDIAQEVFLQVHRSLSSFQGRASLATWIFGIAHNVTCRHYRSSGLQTVSLECGDAKSKLTIAPFAERKLDAVRAVGKCTETLARARTPEHLEIFRLFYGLGRPLRSIARLTGRPVDSVKDSLRRSRNMLLRDVPDVRSTLLSSGTAY